MLADNAGWPAGQPKPLLEMDEVHVWRVSLDIGPDERAWLTRVLLPEERRRADRLLIEQHRARAAVGRGTLRVLLSRYLRCRADAIAFELGPHGKPAIASPWTDLRFNMSHSAGLALIAISRGRAVGVDVERLEHRSRAEAIAERFFAPEEQLDLIALPEALREGAFLAAWTRKEAYAKARGDGISVGFERFSVTLAPGAPPALRRLIGDAADASGWTLHDLRPAIGFIGALAVAGQPTPLRCWTWRLDLASQH